MWVKDEDNGRYKAVAYIGLVVLAGAFGYAIGADRAMTTGAVKTMYSPTSLQTFGMLSEAAEEARDKGDVKSAAHFEAAAAAQKTRVIAWSIRAREEVARRMGTQE